VPDRNGCVYIYNKTRESFIGTEISVADTYLTRLVGLLGKGRRWCQPGRGLWIHPSQGIHTIGMLFPIDIVFLSKEKRVLALEEYVRPFRVSSVHLNSESVLELPPHTIFQSRIQVGDLLEIIPRRHLTPGVEKEQPADLVRSI
jgi:uncharacterized protein